MSEGKPTLFIIAGPDGSGKTTYYDQNVRGQSKIPEHLRAQYITADKPILSNDKVAEQLGEKGTRAFGAGNIIAQQQTREAIAEKRSVTYETSFANRGDVAIVDQAKASGYHVVIAHLQTRSAELTVARVAERVREGGRDAPASSVREQYDTAPKLIAEASKKADYTFVQDTSLINQQPRHLATLERGRVTNSVPTAEMPTWAKEAYGQQLQSYRDTKTSAAERSFASAIEKAEQRVPGAHVQIAGHKPGSYSGPIVDQTAHHALQQTGPKEFVAHFNARVAVGVSRDQNVNLTYGANREPAKVEYLAPAAPRDPEKAKAEVRDFLTQPRDQASQNPRLAAAYAAYDALQSKAAEAGPRTDKVERDVDALIKNSIAARLHSGKTIEVSKGQVDAVQYQVASRSLDSALQEKQLNPERNPRIDPEHRRIIVDRSEQIVRATEGRASTIEPQSPAFKEAQRIAGQLAKHDGVRADSPFASKELANAYQKEQLNDMKQNQQQLQLQQQRQQQRGRGLE